MTTCDSICIGEWIFLILWFVSVPVYCMVMYVIWKKRKTKFKKEFWHLAMALFVADMLHLCQYMWALKMSSWRLLPSMIVKLAPNQIAWLMLVPHVALFFSEQIGVVILSMNRYLAIMKPQYNALWTRNKTSVCICCQWSITIMVLLYHIPLQFNIETKQYNNDTIYIPVIDPRDKQMASMFLGVVFGLGGIMRFTLFGVMYSRMFYHVYKSNKAVEPFQSVRSQNQQSSKHERNLAVIGGLLAFCDMCITIHSFEVAILMNQLDDKIDHEQIRIWVFRNACFTDIYGWMNGWLLLVFSRSVRNEFLEQYRCSVQ